MSRFILSSHPQGSDDWKRDRAGKATGSRARDILARIKSGEAAARRDYRVQLVTERLLGEPAEDGFVSKEMQHGIDQEPFARMAFEIATGLVVREAGFAYLPDLQAGCSTDGFIDDGKRLGFFEAKCPKTATHITYLLAGRLPPEYGPQITHNFWITGADFCDFASYDPRLPEYLQLFHVRIERNEVDVKGHETEVLQFLAEVDALEKQLRERSRAPLAIAA